MIKIEPLFATDTTQTRALLRHQDEPMPYETYCAEDELSLRGLTFWQHWVPCQLHVASSVYVAKEDGVVLGLISLKNIGKSRACWRIEHLVVHPTHRGRGIAQELLRFAFALFGSQGVNHFIAEVSDQNSAGLNILGNCGFRRCAKITHYQVPADFEVEVDGLEVSAFRLALPEDKQRLFVVHQDSLPPDHRLIYELVPDDFAVPDIPLESFEKVSKKLIKRKSWFWVSQDPERKVITSAVRVIAHQQTDYHLEFAVHPGWTHMAPQIIAYALTMMRRAGMKGMIMIKAFDYQPSIMEALENFKLDRVGAFSLLAREHWVRAKQPKKLKLEAPVKLAPIANPAINLPRSLRIKHRDGL
ncbi:MAG TPA: GNAT family N-acetyltransferase [Oculatellaceae cyanobacterium]